MLASGFALNMQLVAQGWLVYEMTSSAINLTLVTLAFMLPQVVFSLLGGVLADRVEKKPLIGWTPAINGIATLIMGSVIISDNASFWDFIWVGALNGTVLALTIPARTALIPEIVGERLMFNAMAFNTASWNLSRILGPALAGFIIAIFASGDTSSTFGVALVYFLLSGLYFISAASIIFLKTEGLPVPRARKNPVQEIADGIEYVWRTPAVSGLILLSILPFLFGLTINTILPAFSKEVLNGGPDDLGFLMTSMGGGAILGSLTLAKMGNIKKKGYWIIGTGSFWGFLVVIFALSETFFVATTCIALIGFVSAVNMSMNRSLVQLQVEQHMRGRIMSIDMMSHGLMPLGLMPIGFIAENISVSVGLITSGTILCLCTLIFGSLMPKVKAINTGY